MYVLLHLHKFPTQNIYIMQYVNIVHIENVFIQNLTNILISESEKEKKQIKRNQSPFDKDLMKVLFDKSFQKEGRGVSYLISYSSIYIHLELFYFLENFSVLFYSCLQLFCFILFCSRIFLFINLSSRIILFLSRIFFHSILFENYSIFLQSYSVLFYSAVEFSIY